ncbi:hypothetical protein BTJ39_11160 [Izhakiella australiensis]|uniref:Uncharacterized protein n=1 Tax=Izhakiella australiensis TaxID=1926881 RepID=A0A1S8YM45_9GAMM|nr:hypothetical protein BTJ39_11160 [Izhakiella australiensis]
MFGYQVVAFLLRNAEGDAERRDIPFSGCHPGNQSGNKREMTGLVDWRRWKHSGAARQKIAEL